MLSAAVVNLMESRSFPGVDHHVDDRPLHTSADQRSDCGRRTLPRLTLFREAWQQGPADERRDLRITLGARHSHRDALPGF